jgi:hypothetical protein
VTALRRLVAFVRENPFLLSHHPRCRFYDHHTVTVRGYDLCMGCFTVYPVGGGSLLALGILSVVVPEVPPFTLSTTGVYAVAAGLAAPLVVSKTLPGSRSVGTRLIVKALLAVGLAVGFLPALTRPGDRFQTLALVGGGLVAYVAYKGLTAFDDCEGCPERESFPDCPGLDFDHAPCDGCTSCAIPRVEDEDAKRP